MAFYMKTLAVLTLLMTAALALAQPAATNATITTTTTTTASTTPTEVSGDIVSYNATTAVLVVQVPDAAAPVTYKTLSSTVLVDYASEPITVAFLQPGRPVTVYSTVAAPNVATKVRMRKYAK